MRKYRILYVLMFLPLSVIQVVWCFVGAILGFAFLGWLIPLGMMCYGYIKGGENHWYQHFPINSDNDYYDFDGWYSYISTCVWWLPALVLDTIREYGREH